MVWRRKMPFLRKALPSPIPNPATASYTCSTSPSTLLRTAALCLRWMMKADAAPVSAQETYEQPTIQFDDQVDVVFQLEPTEKPAQ